MRQRSLTYRRGIDLGIRLLSGLAALFGMAMLGWILSIVILQGMPAINWQFFTELPAPPGMPGGAVRLNTSVGEVSVHSGAKNIGDVDLDSNIGEVSLRVDGDDIEPERSMFVGSRLSWSGDGDDDIDVRVNVGEIVVRID